MQVSPPRGRGRSEGNPAGGVNSCGKDISYTRPLRGCLFTMGPEWVSTEPRRGLPGTQAAKSRTCNGRKTAAGLGDGASYRPPSMTQSGSSYRNRQTFVVTETTELSTPASSSKDHILACKPSKAMAVKAISV